MSQARWIWHFVQNARWAWVTGKRRGKIKHPFPVHWSGSSNVHHMNVAFQYWLIDDALFCRDSGLLVWCPGMYLQNLFPNEAQTMICAIPFINWCCPGRVLTTWNEVSVTAVLCCGTLYPKMWEKLNQSGNLKSKSNMYLSRRTLTRQSCKTVCR